MELNILNLFTDKSVYERYNRFITKGAVSKETQIIMKDLEEWYTTEDEVDDWSRFSLWFFTVQHPTMKDDAVELYQKIFALVEAAKIAGAVVDPKIIDSFILRDYADRIVEASSKVAEGTAASIDPVMELIDEYYLEVDKAGDLESLFVTTDMHVLAKELAVGHGLNWRLQELNDALGPLRIGDFIIMSARVESGKTTFLASEASFMAGQLAGDTKVLWCNNEEAGNKVQRRIMQSALGWTQDAMDADVSKSITDYTTLMNGNINRVKVFDQSVMHKSDIEALLKNFDAGLIIIDQLWKVRGFEKQSASEVDRQALLFGWARGLAKTHAPVITVHQADNSAHGQLYIEMNQLYGSKTAIQGEADAIITLGRSYDAGFENTRGLYVPKNKMRGGDPAFRQGKWEIIIQPEIARYKGA